MTPALVHLGTAAQVAVPLAHIGHFLWIFYLIPVLIVVGGIIRSTRADKRRDQEEGTGPEDPTPDGRGG
jgi:hypothetical protein